MLENGMLLPTVEPECKLVDNPISECEQCEFLDEYLHEYDGEMLCADCWSDRVIQDYCTANNELSYIFQYHKNFFKYLVDLINKGFPEDQNFLLAGFMAISSGMREEMRKGFCYGECGDKVHFAEYLVSMDKGVS